MRGIWGQSWAFFWKSYRQECCWNCTEHKQAVIYEKVFISGIGTLFYLREGDNLKIEGLGMVGRVEVKNETPVFSYMMPNVEGVINKLCPGFLASLPKDVLSGLTATQETGLNPTVEKVLKNALGIRNGGLPTKNSFSPTHHDVTLQLLFLGLITVVEVRDGNGISIHRLDIQVTDKGCKLLGFTDAATVRGIILMGKQ